MPAAVPDRYALEMRLGRDGDLEEWLATDRSLERPVLLRSLGPESTEQRRDQFVRSVAAAATVAHPHLAKVYAVEMVEGGAYSVSEWTGGATVADRVGAGQTFDLDEFLPNAAGLAGALADLHGAGGIHGGIDLSAITYSAAHAAKLGRFGREPETDAAGDVTGLAGALETALTGQAPGGPPPSEHLDGVSRSVDQILRSGQAGEMTAGQLEQALLAAPTPRVPQPGSRSGSRRLLIAATLLVVAAVGLVALGRFFSGGGPILPDPPTVTTAPAATTTAVPPTTTPVAGVAVVVAEAFDPFGEGGENDLLVDNVLDGDATTTWRTERYQDPLPAIKPGVGLRFDVDGTPGQIQLLGFSAGTRFEIRWSAEVRPDPANWERIAEAAAPAGAAAFNLPPRTDGHWLLWLVDVPQQPDGTFYAELAQVRFAP